MGSHNMTDHDKKLVSRLIRHLKQSGEWVDATQKAHKEDKRDLLKEIENLVERALKDKK